MSTLAKDELGFVRARRYGRISGRELHDLLDVSPNEQIYVSGVEGGVRTARPIESAATMDAKPGDTFTVGPRITKASSDLPEQIRKETDALQRSGFGSVQKPCATEWGWGLRLKGLTLPGGMRTDALILLPRSYPLTSPIGFYIRKGAETGHLDEDHLFDAAYHGAKNLSKDGWQWFCGILLGWKPGRHTLVTYLSIVLSLFN